MMFVDSAGRRKLKDEDVSNQNLETYLTDMELEITNRGEQATLGKYNKYMNSAENNLMRVFLLKYLPAFIIELHLNLQ